VVQTHPSQCILACQLHSLERMNLLARSCFQTPTEEPASLESGATFERWSKGSGEVMAIKRSGSPDPAFDSMFTS